MLGRLRLEVGYSDCCASEKGVVEGVVLNSKCRRSRAARIGGHRWFPDQGHAGISSSRHGRDVPEGVIDDSPAEQNKGDGLTAPNEVNCGEDVGFFAHSRLLLVLA